MLASQIRQRYKDELEIDLSDYTSDFFDGYDFLISLIPPDKTFKSDKPVIVVNSFLTDADHENIRRAIDRYAFVKRIEPGAAGRMPLTERIDRVVELLNTVKGLIDGFRRIYVDPDCSFEDLVRTASRAASPNVANAALIEKALLEREASSSQVLSRISIVLLHARSAGVEAPVLALFVPARKGGADSAEDAVIEGAAFTQEYFCGAKSCIIMLLPPARKSGRFVETAPGDPCALGGGVPAIMGIVSAALVEDDGFLAAVQRGDIERVRAALEIDIAEYLVQFCRETLKN
jgi:mannitol operon transcriptional antiterminator